MNDLFDSIIQNIVFFFGIYSVAFLGYKVSISKKEGFFKTRKIKGYYTACSDGFTAVMFVLSLFAFSITIMFVVCNYLGITDENENSLIPHIMIFLFLFICSFCLFLYGKRRKIYFNKKELIVYPLLKKSLTISYDEINKIIVAKNRGIVLFTNKGRYVFDEYYSNKDKFIKILEEKEFPIIHEKYFYKRYDKKY